MCAFLADIRMQNALGSAAAHASRSGCAAAEVISEDVVAELHDLVRKSKRDEERRKMIKLMKQDPKLIDAKNKDGDTAMHVAARAGFLRTISVLVELSASYQRGCMYKTNKDGNYPLHLALMYHHYPVAKFLQQKYPLKVWLKLNLEGISPIYLAIVDRYWDLVKDVLQCEGFIKCWNHDKHPLPKGLLLAHAAIDVGNQELLGIVLKKLPILVGSCNERGLTPASYAAARGFS
ncbi:hypothetical protein Droror1_Dr00002723 [Drosera rotundifolia]